MGQALGAASLGSWCRVVRFGAGVSVRLTGEGGGIGLQAHIAGGCRTSSWLALAGSLLHSLSCGSCHQSVRSPKRWYSLLQPGAKVTDPSSDLGLAQGPGTWVPLGTSVVGPPKL